MILNRHGLKRTANELAKELVLDLGESRCYNWQEQFYEAYTDKLTDREETEVRHALARQLERVSKFLGNPDYHRNKEDDE